MTNFIAKYKNIIYLTIGILLIIISFCLIAYDRIELIKANVYNEVELLKYHELNEKQKDDNSIELDDVNTDEIDENDVDKGDNSAKVVQTKKQATKIAKEYIGYLEIEKIKLKLGMVSKNSYYNNVDYNIQIINSSDYPDKEYGNTIIAGHSGNGYIGFFKNLYKLSIGDKAKIYYKKNIYSYEIVDIYNVPKTGTVAVVRDPSKTCLTLITCTHNSDTEQTVYILELKSVESEAK